MKHVSYLLSVAYVNLCTNMLLNKQLKITKKSIGVEMFDTP